MKINTLCVERYVGKVSLFTKVQQFIKTKYISKLSFIKTYSMFNDRFKIQTKVKPLIFDLKTTTSFSCVCLRFCEQSQATLCLESLV